jgi:hypothetical protein
MTREVYDARTVSGAICANKTFVMNTSDMHKEIIFILRMSFPGHLEGIMPTKACFRQVF